MNQLTRYTIEVSIEQETRWGVTRILNLYKKKENEVAKMERVMSLFMEEKWAARSNG